MKYKNEHGIELQMAGDDSTKTLIREVVSEAVRMCTEYNWHDKNSMRFTLSNIKQFLVENFDLEEENEE